MAGLVLQLAHEEDTESDATLNVIGTIRNLGEYLTGHARARTLQNFHERLCCAVPAAAVGRAGRSPSRWTLNDAIQPRTRAGGQCYSTNGSVA